MPFCRRAMDMGMKERIENNAIPWLPGTLATGFLAGIATYKSILEIAHLDVVARDSYVTKDKFKQATDQLRDPKALLGSVSMLISEGRSLEALPADQLNIAF